MVPIILGRPFLTTTRMIMDFADGCVVLQHYGDKIVFRQAGQTEKHAVYCLEEVEPVENVLVSELEDEMIRSEEDT